MRVIAVANQKGGCGKTTSAINLSATLALLQKKILLIDMDPQGHSTCGFGFDARKLSYSLYDLLSPCEELRPPLESVIQTVNPFLDILPSYEILSALEEELVHAPEREKRLRQALKELFRKENSYDYILLDCPPNLGLLTFNALEASDEVIIPVEPSFFSLHGLAKISETIELANQQRENALNVHALLTIFDARTKFAKEVYDEVKLHFGENLFTSIIHESVILKEAASAGKSVVDYDQSSGAFQDYLNLAMEYLERDWNRKLPEEELGWMSAARQKYGPKRVPGGILFQAVFQDAKYVEIVGDFNHWIPELMVRRDTDGLWQKVVPLVPGTYRYKLIVDGEWQIDPYQPTQTANAFGTHDSLLEIA